MRRLPLHMLDPAGANDGDVPTFDEAANRLVYATPPSGSGGGASTLDELSDVDTDTLAPTDGEVLKFDADRGLWVPGSPGEPGSAAVWTQITNVPGTSWTAANWLKAASPAGGTWSSDGSVISTTGITNQFSRVVRAAKAESMSGADFLAVEAEILVPASGFVGNSSKSIGVCIDPGGTAANPGGAAFRIDGNNQVRIEKDGISLVGTAPLALTAGAWYRLSLEIAANGSATGYVDGVQTIGPIAISSPAMDRAGLFTWNGAGSFRNLKAWRYGGEPAPPFATS